MKHTHDFLHLVLKRSFVGLQPLQVCVEHMVLGFH